jgi:nitronate monooxygenase
MTEAPSLFQGLRLPVIAAPMFLVSNPAFANACRDAGVVGTFPALNARTTEDLKQWCESMERGSALAPWGVNLIVHRSNPRLMDDLAVLEALKAPLVITSLGAVPDLVAKVHSWGGKVFHDVTNGHHARKAAAAGVDGIIAVAAGAGGHAGTWNPFALAAEIRSFFQGSLVLAGCINTGGDVVAAQAMGADYAYMGTRFIATAEAHASAEYKQMILDSKVEDIVYTPAVSGIPASFMRASLEKAGYDMEKLKNPGDIDYGQKLKPVDVDNPPEAGVAPRSGIDKEAKAWKTVWSAGQGVGSIHDVPTVAELVERLAKERDIAKARLI